MLLLWFWYLYLAESIYFHVVTPANSDPPENGPIFLCKIELSFQSLILYLIFLNRISWLADIKIYAIPFLMIPK